MSGRATVNIAGYAVDDSVNSDDDIFNIATGSTLVLLGDDALTDDAVSGSGRVSVRGATTIDDSLALSGSTLLVNSASVTQNGSTVALGQSADDTVIARNTAGSTWTFKNGSKITSDGGSQFVNLGVLNQASGITTIDANFYDRKGTIEINSGAFAGLFFASPGDVNRFVDDKIEGNGEFQVDDHGVLVGSNISTLTTYLTEARVVGSVHVSSSNDYLDVVNLGAGSVLSLTNSAASVTLGDEIVGAGTLLFRGDDNLSAYETSLVGDVELENFGALQVGSANVTAKSWSDDTIIIENAAGATWTDSSENVFASAGPGKTVFINDGTFIDAGYQAIFGLSVVNNGVMQAGTSSNYDSSFALSSVTGTGTIDIGDVLATVGSVGSGQTFDFDSALAGAYPATLDLADPQDFAGTITGFDQGGVTNDTLILNTTTWRYEGYEANSSGTGGSLVVADGSETATINLTGSYDVFGFNVAATAGQTTITYKPSNRSLVKVLGYTVDDNVELSNDLYYLASGATQVLLGDDLLTDDAFEGAGHVNVRGVATIDDGLALAAAQFVDMSEVTQNGSSLKLAPSAYETVTARNIAGAVWTLENSASITGNGLSQFVNLGLFDQTGGTSTIDATFYDRGGTIEANGVLIFASPSDDNRFVDDTIGGTGTIDFADGAVLDGTNVSTSTTDLSDARIVGNVDISSATLEFDDLNLGAGSVLNLTNQNGAITFGYNNEVIGAGALDIKGADNVSLSYNAFAAVLVGDVTLANYGDTQFTGYNYYYYESVFSVETKPWTDDTVTIENELGATWTDIPSGSSYYGESSSFTQVGATGSSVFLNNGTFEEDASGGVYFGFSVVNNGVIETGAGLQAPYDTPNFTFSSSLSGSGTVELGLNNVTLGGAAASSQTLNFNDVTSPFGPPSLILNDPQDFAAIVSGFDQSAGLDDKITLNSTSAGAWEFVGYQSSGSGGALTFTNGGETASIKLAGSYTADDFHATLSGNSTTMTYG